MIPIAGPARRLGVPVVRLARRPGLAVPARNGRVTH